MRKIDVTARLILKGKAKNAKVPNVKSAKLILINLNNIGNMKWVSHFLKIKPNDKWFLIPLQAVKETTKHEKSKLLFC